MYDFAVNRNISLSGHLSNIDEIDKFNIKVLNWIAWMFWPSYKTLTPPKKFHHRLALFNYMKNDLDSDLFHLSSR